MASGSGKNQRGIQTKEPVPPAPPSERLREEPNAAAAAAAAAETHPPAPPSDCLQERTHGSLEAGGQNTPAAEAAAAAQRSGTGIEAPSQRGSVDGKPTLSPRAASASRVREPKPAGGKPPLPRCPVPASRSKSEGKKPMSHAEVVESGMVVRAKWKEMREGRKEMKEAFNELLEESKKAMPEQGTATQQKEQTIPMTKPHGIVKQQKEQLVQHKNKTVREMDRKAKPEEMEKRESWRINRRWSRLIIILLLFSCLPTVTAFQRFQTLDKAADHLGRHPYLQQMQDRLAAEEAHGRRILCWTAGAIAAASFLLGEFVVGVGQEAEINMAGMTAIVVLAVVIIVLIVALRFVVRRA